MLKNFKSFYLKHLIIFWSLIAILTLLYSAGFFGLNWDETFSINISKLNFKQISLVTINDVHPPLYYYLLKLWIGIFGDSEFMLRILSLIFYLIAVVIILKIVKKIFQDPKIITLIAIILTFSGYFIQYANDIRMYSLSLLLISLSFLTYLNLSDKKSNRFLLTVLIFLATLTHYVAIIFFIGLVLYDFFSKGKSIRNLSFIKESLTLYRSIILALLLYLPWIVAFIKYRNVEIGSSWVPIIYPAEIIYQPILFLTGKPIPTLSKPQILLSNLFIYFVIFLILLFLRKTLNLWRFIDDKKYPALKTFIIISFFTYSINFITANRFPAFYFRYLLIATSLWFLLSLAELFNKLIKINLLKYVFGFLLILGLFDIFITSPSLEPRKIADCLKNANPHSIYLIKNNWDYAIYSQYLGIENVYFLTNNINILTDHDIWIETKIQANKFYYLNIKDLQEFKQNSSNNIVLFDDNDQVSVCRENL